jgi:hypothetical protein
MKSALGTLVLLLACLPTPARAQGCSQCTQAVGQTPAQTRSAYRRAITVMVVAGAGIFSAGIIVMRRFR